MLKFVFIIVTILCTFLNGCNDGQSSNSDNTNSSQQTTGTQNQDPVDQCNATVSDLEQIRFEAAAAYSYSMNGQAVLVSKCGKVVYENYVSPMDASTPHSLASGTKSFSCALYALGHADGFWSLDENVSETITEWQDDDRKSELLLRHLLTLSGGLGDPEGINAQDLPFIDTYLMAIEDSTTPRATEEAFIYAASNFQILSAMFERKTNTNDAIWYLNDRLFTKLGFAINNVERWGRDKIGKPLLAGGAHFTAREWANYGQLFLQGGWWNGEQLLDPNIVSQCISFDNPAFRGYGLTWWLNNPTDGTLDPFLDRVPIHARGDGNQIASNAPDDMFMAAGTGDQRLYVIPSHDMVIVHFGPTVQGSDWSDHLFMEYLLGVP